MSDKLFVLKIREYNGEQEYTENIYTIAPDEEVAKKWARECVKHWYDDDDDCYVIDKNGKTDSLWWTYRAECGYPSWYAMDLSEKYELDVSNHAEGCENNNSKVKLVIE